MPVDVMILSAIIVSIFAGFGAVLYWGESRTRGLSKVESPKLKRRSF